MKALRHSAITEFDYKHSFENIIAISSMNLVSLF